MFFCVIDVNNMGKLIRQGNFFTLIFQMGKTSSGFFLSLLSPRAKIKV